jgi:hypothetical protein
VDLQGDATGLAEVRRVVIHRHAHYAAVEDVDESSANRISENLDREGLLSAPDPLTAARTLLNLDETVTRE